MKVPVLGLAQARAVRVRKNNVSLVSLDRVSFFLSVCINFLRHPSVDKPPSLREMFVFCDCKEPGVMQ